MKADFAELLDSFAGCCSEDHFRAAGAAAPRLDLEKFRRRLYELPGPERKSAQGAGSSRPRQGDPAPLRTRKPQITGWPHRRSRPS